MRLLSIKEYALAHKLSIYNVVKMTKNGTLNTQTKVIDGRPELFIAESDEVPVTKQSQEKAEETIEDYESAYHRLKKEYDVLKSKYTELEKKISAKGSY